MAVEVGAALYDPTNTTLVSALEEAFGRRWRAQKNEKGSAALSLALDDPDRAALRAVRNRVVRFTLDGTAVWAGVVRRPQVTLRASSEEEQEQADYPVHGLLHLFDEVRVEPELGAGSISPKTRRFDHSSKYFDASAWDDAVEIKQQSATSPAQWTTDTGQAPDKFTDGTAWWIWSRAQVVGPPPQPVGRIPWRYEFTLADEGLYGFEFSADDGREIILDGEVIDADLGEFAWGNTHEVKRFLSAGDHVLAGWAENMPRDLAASNVAGFILSCHEMDNGGKTWGAVVFHSDDTWKVLDYPAAPPRMTPGHIVRVLVEEAQDRGMLTGLTLDFTDDLDSNGDAWATPVDLVVQVGDTYWNVLRQIIETSVDVRMAAIGLELQMFNKGEMGTASGVTWNLDLDLASAGFDGEDATGTAMLTQDERGYWTWREAPLIGVVGRVEVAEELGAAPSDDAADMMASAIFDEIGQARDHGSFGVEPASGEVPFVDVLVGDTVTLVDVDEVPAGVEMEAATVAEDENGFAVFTVEAVVEEGGS